MFISPSLFESNSVALEMIMVVLGSYQWNLDDGTICTAQTFLSPHAETCDHTLSSHFEEKNENVKTYRWYCKGSQPNAFKQQVVVK